ncbi:MAG: hypothetical protein KGZ62_05580 [Sulfurimonas sp.]|nr:hypothetical protein [Sulfurimonas sp.]
MKKIVLIVVAAFFLISCGGGSSDSGQASSDLFEDAFAILNRNKSQGQFHSTTRSDSSKGHYNDCSDAFSISRATLRSFVESETAYALCGHRSSGYKKNQLFLYPGSDAYRWLELLLDPASPDAQEERIKIPLSQGQINVTLTYDNLGFEYEFKAQNNSTKCDSDTLAVTTTYAESEIDGVYSATLVKIDSNGVPVTGSKGSISCDSGSCNGIVTISEMEYDSHTESWSGQLAFEGVKYDLIAILSPDKSIAAFVGVPSLSEVIPQNFSKSCLFIGAYRGSNP